MKDEPHYHINGAIHELPTYEPTVLTFENRQIFMSIYLVSRRMKIGTFLSVSVPDFGRLHVLEAKLTNE